MPRPLMQQMSRLMSALARRNAILANGARPAKAPHARFEAVKNAADDVADLYIYGDICWYDITAQMVVEALAQIDAGTIRVRINSGGGDIFEGVAIYNLLRERASKSAIEVHVDALAASIASVIAMAGDEIVIAKNARMMIHRAWGCCVGDVDDMRAFADVLEGTETDSIVSTYVDRTGLKSDEIVAMMKAETWLSAQDCVDKGFADKIGDTTTAKASVRKGLYDHAPADLFDDKNPKPAPAVEPAATPADTALRAKMHARALALSTEV